MTAIRATFLMLALSGMVLPATALGQAAAPPKETPWGLSYAESKPTKDGDPKKITIQYVLRTSLGDRVGFKEGDTVVQMSVTPVGGEADLKMIRCESDLNPLLKKVTDAKDTCKVIILVDRLTSSETTSSNESLVRPRGNSKTMKLTPTRLTCTVKPIKKKPGSFYVSEVEVKVEDKK